VSRAAARFLVAAIFLSGGVDVLRDPEPRVRVAKAFLDRLEGVAPWLVRDRVALVRANAAVQILAAGALATGRRPREAALALAASLVPTTLGGHRFWEHEDPAQRSQQRTHFLKNAAILGGLLFAAESESY
jgi:putative oxidoreductase